MNGLMLHCGSQSATLEEVRAVPAPQHTDTWKPVPYRDTLDLVKEVATQALGPIMSEAYGLNKDGKQMFGLLRFACGGQDHGLSIGLRGSIDKTLGNGIAVGANVFVCDNLCFSGEAFKIVRRNTTNVWEDLSAMIREHIAGAGTYYGAVSRDIERMKEISCSQDRGYEILGLLQGHGLLRPRQAGVALSDWRTPRHEEFAERDLWSLYNCATEGLKKAAPGQVIDSQTKLHSYVMRLAA
jgi:hypothetical protein